MLDVFFVDDARQARPSRTGMGALVAAGFVHVPSENVRHLEAGLQELCARVGFPDGRVGEFKWSPGRDLWMRDNLIGEARTQFFLDAIEIAAALECRCAVAVNDTTYPTATGCAEHTMDVANLLLERVEWRLRQVGRTGIIVADRPSGGRGDEDAFLTDCLETISVGTNYLQLDRIAINAVSTPSELVRSLQLADVVTSSTLAHVAGEDTYSPPIFAAVRPLLHQDRIRTGGMGLKIHPDIRYGNLYHWLLDDSEIVRGNTGYMLPYGAIPYSTSPDAP